MSNDLSNWTMENGLIVIRPVTEFTTFIGFDSAVCLRVEFVKKKEWLKTGQRASEQFVLTPDQADQLADMLTRQARNARQSRSAGTKSN